ncbi:MAG: hypothetical protein ACRBB0_26250, partial [Pelagimonas sp.]|uniref:hypothetical protein n=1 Tax=Pelagimonas sp. TaxID=2073170 RepID=UPI003D6C2C9D
QHQSFWAPSRLEAVQRKVFVQDALSQQHRMTGLSPSKSFVQSAALTPTWIGRAATGRSLRHARIAAVRANHLVKPKNAEFMKALLHYELDLPKVFANYHKGRICSYPSSFHPVKTS